MAMDFKQDGFHSGFVNSVLFIVQNATMIPESNIGLVIIFGTLFWFTIFFLIFRFENCLCDCFCVAIEEL